MCFSNDKQGNVRLQGVNIYLFSVDLHAVDHSPESSMNPSFFGKTKTIGDSAVHVNEELATLILHQRRPTTEDERKVC